MKKNANALSPIFSTLVILAVVTVLFVPVFIWSANLTGETRSFWELSGVIAAERIVVEEVNLKGGVSTCTVYVRNIGKTAVTIANVFIASPDGSLHVYERLDFSASPESAVQGDLVTVTIPNLRFTPEGGKVYAVRVFTARGVGDTYQAVA